MLYIKGDGLSLIARFDDAIRNLGQAGMTLVGWLL
jgi:hypothetical protein